MSRRLAFDQLLALVSVGWLCVLAALPALTEQPQLFWATVVLLAYNFGVLVGTFARTRRVLVATNCMQLVLFGVLSYQLTAAFGAEHYRFDRDPGWYEWTEYAIAHVLRAADFLDALDEYGWHVHEIHHESIEASLLLVCLHLSADLFLLSLVGRWLWQWWKSGAQVHETSLQRGRRGCAVLMLSGTVLATFSLYAVMQEWSGVDWLLWPLDNVLRLLDVGDVFQVFHMRLHGVDMDAWTRAYAIAFRFAAGLCLAQFMPWVRLWGFSGHWYSEAELIDFLQADQAAFRAEAARALGRLKSDAADAVPALQQLLAHDPDVTVRCQAATALGRLGRRAAPAVDDLASALWHPHRPLRFCAAHALGCMGSAACGALKDLLYFGRTLTDDRPLTDAIWAAVARIDPRGLDRAALATQCGDEDAPDDGLQVQQSLTLRGEERNG
jgi:hypothetical protein